MASRDKLEFALEVDNVSKSFKLPIERPSGIKQAFVNWTRGIKGYKKQQVLKGISFKVEKGDFFGIVGRNGSGKSTLLKLISQIYVPDSGKIKVNGKLVPFIELGVGFNPELTGRENIYMNGALLGFSNKEVDKMYDEIVDFAELHDFMDQKLKNYSSGMQVRLAFSIAIKAQGDILVLDEVLAVGDEAFQRKCSGFFEKIKKDSSKTVILVTHSMENVRQYCNKAMIIDDRSLKSFGSPEKIADEYSKVNLLNLDKKVNGHADEPRLSAKIVDGNLLHPDNTVEVKIKYKALNDRPIFAKAYIDFNGQVVMATNPGKIGWDNIITEDTNEHIVLYSLSLKHFNKGEYKIVVLLEDLETKVNIASFGYNGEVIMKIENPDKSSGNGTMKNQATMELIK